MSWAKENKFLSGYIVVMVIGVGALGYKVFSASSALDDANARYTAKAANYDSLRRVAPFPSRENLTKVEAQKKEAADVISSFQADLAKREFPIQPLSPVEFQDQLKKAVTEAKSKAENVTKLDKFYLGFDRYETAPPDKDVVNLLGRELKAIEWVVDQFLAASVLELKLTRPEMPEEKGKAAAKPVSGPQKGPGPGKPTQPELLTTRSFEVSVKCKQRQLANVLTAIVSANAPQFYIIRSVKVVNEKTKGPPKADPNAAVDPAAAVPATPGTPVQLPQGEDLHYIVGEEHIDATLRIDIVDFSEPPTTAAK